MRKLPQQPEGPGTHRGVLEHSLHRARIASLYGPEHDPRGSGTGWRSPVRPSPVNVPGELENRLQRQEEPASLSRSQQGEIRLAQVAVGDSDERLLVNPIGLRCDQKSRTDTKEPSSGAAAHGRHAALAQWGSGTGQLSLQDRECAGEAAHVVELVQGYARQVDER